MAIVGIFDIWPLDGQWQLELAAFAIITTAPSFYAPSKVNPWLHRTQSDHLTLNERGARKIGRKAHVEKAFENGPAKVRLGDTVRIAESTSGKDFEECVQAR